MKNALPWFIFIIAAILEIGGDAVIRKGLRSSGLLLIITGFLMLGCYGIIVNTLRWDFSKILGIYVAFFAAISILAGRLVFKESAPASTWIGMAVIICGALIIQFGQR